MGGFSTAVPPPFTGLTVTPPDPYSNLRALAMQGQIAQQRQTLAAGQQEMAGRQQQMQLVDQQIKDQQALAQTLREWTPGTTADEFVKKVIDNGGSGNAGLQAQQHFTDLYLKNAQLGKAQLELQQTRHNQLAGQIQSVIDAKPEDKQALYTQYLPEIKKELDPNEAVPDTYPGDEWGVGQVKGHQLLADQTKQAQERAQAGEAAAKGEQAKAEAGKAKLETQLTQHKLDLYDVLKRNPQELGRRVAASINPQRYPDLYNRTLNEAQNQPDLEGINKAIERGAQAVTEQEKTIATETDPRVLQARTNQAVNTAVAVEKARAQLSPDAFAGIIDPVAKSRALTAWDKAESDYRAKEGDAQRLQDFVSAARSGNQAAAAMIPLAEVKEIISQRINRQELSAAGGGLSVLRRVENWVSTKAQGKPSDDTLNDISNLSNMVLSASRRTYSGNMLRLQNLGYKGPLQPQELPEQPSPAPAQGANGLPAVGGTFNGHKVLKVEKVQ